MPIQRSRFGILLIFVSVHVQKMPTYFFLKKCLCIQVPHDEQILLCHRIIAIKKSRFYTKGDGNQHDDSWLSDGFQYEQIQGKIWLRVPYIGLPVLAVRETLTGKVLVLIILKQKYSTTISQEKSYFYLTQIHMFFVMIFFRFFWQLPGYQSSGSEVVLDIML